MKSDLTMEISLLISMCQCGRGSLTKSLEDVITSVMTAHKGGVDGGFSVSAFGASGEDFFPYSPSLKRASQVALLVKNPPAKAGDIKDEGSIPGSGRFPGEGNGDPLQYSCLENPRDRGTWRAAVHGVAKSWTTLND